jgi:hypothetical protein
VTDNTIVMHKYGTLPVQMPERMQRYLHRNGERLKPMVSGYFGFRPVNREHGWIIFVSEHFGGEMRQLSSTRYEEDYTDLEDGYYWGPITGPWQNNV